MNTDVVPLGAVAAELGEGPVWVARDEALWFVDIAGRRVHRYQPRGRIQSHWGAPEKVSFILPLRSGGFLAGLKSGLHRFDPRSGMFAHYSSSESHLPGNRLNDACVSPGGDLWFGSMHDAESDASGMLYRLERDSTATARDGGYIVTNGPAFSPDGRTFYHTDSYRRVIYSFAHDEAGALSNKRVFALIEEGAGYPDGTAVDAEGCLWIALWAGWAVRRYSPAGELLQTVRFPCANVTKIAFGGDDHCSAYATTAWRGLSLAEREAQPHAGDLFAFSAAVPGLAPVLIDL